jgi:hypothetical protein
MLGRKCHTPQDDDDEDSDGGAPPDVWRRLQAVIEYSANNNSSSGGSSAAPGLGSSDASGKESELYIVQFLQLDDNGGHCAVTV